MPGAHGTKRDEKAQGRSVPAAVNHTHWLSPVVQMAPSGGAARDTGRAGRQNGEPVASIGSAAEEAIADTARSGAGGMDMARRTAGGWDLV